MQRKEMYNNQKNVIEMLIPSSNNLSLLLVDKVAEMELNKNR